MKSECYKIILPYSLSLSLACIFLLLFDLPSVYLDHIHAFSCYSSVRKFKSTLKKKRWTTISTIPISLLPNKCTAIYIYSSLLIRSSLPLFSYVLEGERQVRWSIDNYFDRKYLPHRCFPSFYKRDP